MELALVFKRVRRAACVLLLVVTSACNLPVQPFSPGPVSTPIPVPVDHGSVMPAALKSTLPRRPADAPAGDVQALAAGENAFALDLYRQVSGSEGNLFFSPYSIYLALGMTQAGARGQTREQINAALHFTLPEERLHAAFNTLDQKLAGRQGFRLNIVNDLWGEQSHAFRPEYLDTLAARYGAGIRMVDFYHQPDAVVQQINDYIAGQTQQRIRDLLQPGSLDASTRMVLTNAIYFQAAWAHKFVPRQTQDAPFTRLDGSVVQVPMMAWDQEQSLSYLAGKGFQAAALPYMGTGIEMIVLLPGQGNFEQFEAALAPAQLEKILTGLDENGSLVDLRMPRFEMRTDFPLDSALSEMGMTGAFTPGAADFSGIDGARDLYLSTAVHQAFVKVNEEETEAAAATGGGIPDTGGPNPHTVQITLDRPFLFLIIDRPTNTILFLGRLTDPQTAPS